MRLLLLIFPFFIFITSCQNTSENKATSEHNLKKNRLFQAQKDSLSALFSYPDSTVFNLKSIERHETLIEKHLLSEDSLVMLRQKNREWGAQAYLLLAEKNFESLKELGWDLNDYLNKLDYLEDILYLGYTKYTNTLGGMELKKQFLAFEKFKNVCLERSEEISRFLDIVMSNSIKTKEEIQLLNEFVESIDLNIFNEKIALHQNSYYLNKEIVYFSKFNPISISEVKNFYATLLDKSDKRPINDSLLVLASIIEKKNLSIRKQAIKSEIKTALQEINKNLKAIILKNCALQNFCAFEIDNTSPEITANTISENTVFKVTTILKTGNNCEEQTTQTCNLLISVDKDLQKGFSYQFTSYTN